MIHCHNGERTQLRLPSGSRLRGFPVIGITYNQIRTLPDEETLLAKFPDLKVGGFCGFWRILGIQGILQILLLISRFRSFRILKPLGSAPTNSEALGVFDFGRSEILGFRVFHDSGASGDFEDSGDSEDSEESEDPASDFEIQKLRESEAFRLCTHKLRSSG